MTTRRTNSTAAPEVRSVSEFLKRPLGWLWPGRIPTGKLTVLSGDPNLGKSFVTLDLAARASTGQGWPDGVDDAGPGNVLLLAAEDDAGDTIRPRLERARADLDRVRLLTGMRDEKETLGPRLVSLERDLAAIAGHLDSRRYRLVVIDPISAYLDGLDMNSQRDIRTMLGRLAQVAERSGAAIVLVSHHRKAGGRGPAVYRTLGSLAFTAVARAVWNVSRDPADGQRRLFVPVKMNIAPQPQALAYRIVDPGRVEWEPEPIALSADELSEESLADSDRGDRVAAAKIWLSGFLLGGPRSSGEVKSAARAAGIMPRPLWDAKRELKARAYKEGHTWKWCLPEHYIPQPGEYDHVLLGTGLPPLAGFPLEDCLRTARGEAGRSGRC